MAFFIQYLIIYLTILSKSKYCTEQKMFSELELPFANGSFFFLHKILFTVHMNMDILIIKQKHYFLFVSVL